jgi:hypothetical protein
MPATLPATRRTDQDAALVAIQSPRSVSVLRLVMRVLTLMALGLTVLGEMVLLLVALVPQSVWQSYGYQDGPIPRSLSPEVAAIFYVLPALTGALCRRWQAAVVLATLPAWLDLGAFASAAATRIGPFYLATEPHAVSTVGTLELFAVLGALGWLTRTALFGLLGRGERGRP